ncbi:hypothetical protein BDV97DRAFT_341438 [Delphinella strobiligena]|nr:hypothetical protein BDV97DRAFT_341438 [Delphinella strobiligena]
MYSATDCALLLCSCHLFARLDACCLPLSEIVAAQSLTQVTQRDVAQTQTQTHVASQS